MTPDEEHEFYALPENQEPQGPPRRRGPDAALTPNFEARRQRDRRELAERFAHQQQTRDGAVDEVAKLL